MRRLTENHTRATTTIEENRVTKVDHPAALALEVEKMEAARELGERTGLFVVPKVLHFDAQAGVLVMSRLQNLTPLRTLRGASERELQCYVEAGKCLAIIHQSLALKTSVSDLPCELDDVHSRCWLHGDYTKQNVGVVAEGDSWRIAIIDWQLSKMYGGMANFGTALFDVAWFVSGIFMEPPHRQLGGWFLQKKAIGFLRGYIAQLNDSLHVEDFAAYSHRLLDCRQHEFSVHRSLLGRVGLAPGFWSWANFLDRLDQDAVLGA